MLRQSPCWKASPALAGVPEDLRNWLIDRGSLTARIVARCSSFRVAVLRESLAPPGEDERSLIHLPSARAAWVREVLLIADGRPVVFARSMLVPRDLRGAWHMARAIGSRPLGAALFADPRIRREPLRYVRLEPRHPLHHQAEAAVDQKLPALWARRSRFTRLGHPLLVCEVFLPEITRLAR